MTFEFDEFAVTAGQRLRRALVARHGVEIGNDITDGAFTRVDYVNGERTAQVRLRRTREPITLAEASGRDGYLPCGSVRLEPLGGGEAVGYALGGDTGGPSTGSSIPRCS